MSLSCFRKVMDNAKNGKEFTDFKDKLGEEGLAKLEKEFEVMGDLSPAERDMWIKNKMDDVGVAANEAFKRKVQNIQANRTFVNWLTDAQKKNPEATKRDLVNRYVEKMNNVMEGQSNLYAGDLIASLGTRHEQILLSGKLDKEIISAIYAKYGADIPDGVKVSKDAQEIADKVKNWLDYIRAEQMDAGATVNDVFGFVGIRAHRAVDYRREFPTVEKFREFAETHYHKEKMMEMMEDGETWPEFIDNLHKRLVSDEHIKDNALTREDFSYVHGPNSVAKGLSRHRKIIYKDGAAEFDAMQRLHVNKSLYESLVMATATKAARVKTLLTYQGDDYKAFAKKASEIIANEKQDTTVSRIRVQSEATTFQNIKAAFSADSNRSFKDAVSEFFSPTQRRIEILNGVFDGTSDDLPTIMRFGQFLLDIQPLKLGSVPIMALADQVNVRNMMLTRGITKGNYAIRETVGSQIPLLAKYAAKGKDAQDMARWTHRLAWNRGRSYMRQAHVGGIDPAKIARTINDKYFDWIQLTRIDRSAKLMSTDILEQGIGDYSGVSWKELEATERGKRFAAYLYDSGITPGMWDVMRHAGIRGEEFSTFMMEGIREMPDNMFKPMLDERGLQPTKSNISQLRRELEGNIIDFFVSARRNAIPEPSLATRGVFTWGPPDSYMGFIGRVIGTFKSFPIEIVRQQIRNAMMPGQTVPGAIRIAGMMMAELTLMGYVTWAAKEAMKGKTPPDISDPKVIVQSIARGGALGPLADILLRDYTKYGSSIGDIALSGPAVGDVDAAIRMTQKLATAAINGEWDKAGEAAKAFGVRSLPNPWPLQIATTAVMGFWADDMYMFMTEGQKRVMREQGQEFFIGNTLE